MQIRRREPGDDAEWLRMRCALWPEATAAEHQADMVQWAALPEAAVFVAARPGGEKLAGFAEVGTRSYADGCESSPVGYLAGWYVDPDLRRQGIGAALLRAAEKWARERGVPQVRI